MGYHRTYILPDGRKVNLYFSNDKETRLQQIAKYEAQYNIDLGNVSKPRRYTDGSQSYKDYLIDRGLVRPAGTSTPPPNQVREGDVTRKTAQPVGVIRAGQTLTEYKGRLGAEANAIREVQQGKLKTESGFYKTNAGLATGRASVVLQEQARQEAMQRAYDRAKNRYDTAVMKDTIKRTLYRPDPTLVIANSPVNQKPKTKLETFIDVKVPRAQERVYNTLGKPAEWATDQARKSVYKYDNPIIPNRIENFQKEMKVEAFRVLTNAPYAIMKGSVDMVSAVQGTYLYRKEAKANTDPSLQYPTDAPRKAAMAAFKPTGKALAKQFNPTTPQGLTNIAIVMAATAPALDMGAKPAPSLDIVKAVDFSKQRSLVEYPAVREVTPKPVVRAGLREVPTMRRISNFFKIKQEPRPVVSDYSLTYKRFVGNEQTFQRSVIAKGTERMIIESPTKGLKLKETTAAQRKIISDSFKDLADKRASESKPIDFNKVTGKDLSPAKNLFDNSGRLYSLTPEAGIILEGARLLEPIGKTGARIGRSLGEGLRTIPPSSFMTAGSIGIASTGPGLTKFKNDLGRFNSSGFISIGTIKPSEKIDLGRKIGQGSGIDFGSSTDSLLRSSAALGLAAYQTNRLIARTSWKSISPEIPKPPKLPDYSSIGEGGGSGFFKFKPPEGGGYRRGFGVFNKSKSSERYTPSLVAIAFGIKGKRPKGRLSGLEFRPVLDDEEESRKGKKRKKKSRKVKGLIGSVF